MSTQYKKLDNKKDSPKNKVKAKSGIKAIQIAGVLFVVVFTAIIIANLFITRSLDKDSTAINLAGRQRMLSQRITKATNTLLDAVVEQDRKVIKSAQDELELSHGLFNDTLIAFRDGGKTKGANGDSVNLIAIRDANLRQHLTDASELWEPISTEIEGVISLVPSSIEAQDLSSSAAAMTHHNLTLLKLMNNLTVGLENSAKSKSSTLQTILWCALLLVFVNFAYIVFYALQSIIKRDIKLKNYADTMESNFHKLQGAYTKLEETQDDLNKSNSSLQGAMESLNVASNEAHQRANELELTTIDLNRLKDESDTIFNSVDHGLCLLDSNYVISSRVSLAMCDIFENEHLRDMSFVDLMRPLIPEKDLKTLESFLKLQFSAKTMNQQLQKYNPLKQIEVTLNWDGDNFSKKQLGFDFERITEGEEIVAVLVTITDVTEKMAMENKLKRASEAQERKTSILLEIVSGDANELKIFLGQTESTLDQINDALKAQGISSTNNSIDSSKDLVEEVFRKVHNIKGNASMLGLNTIVDITHEVEDELSALRRKKNIEGEEFLNSLLGLASLRERLNDYDEVVHTVLKDFATGRTESTPEVTYTKSESLGHEIADFNQKLAEDLGKKVFTNYDLNIEDLSEKGLDTVKDVLIQLNRNVLVHGIEEPESRIKSGKLERGSVVVTFTKDTSSTNILGEPSYHLNVRDDGAGLNIEAIRSKAVELGMVSEVDAKSLPKADVVKYIFKPEFSTVAESTEHAGRGVGLDLIKSLIVKELGGKLSVSFSKGSFMQVSCVVPASAVEREETMVTL